jgi:hypothetical protein
MVPMAQPCMVAQVRANWRMKQRVALLGARELPFITSFLDNKEESFAIGILQFTYIL